MRILTHKEELFGLAFRLAFFIHRRKDVAIKIATNAVLKLDIASTAQEKRFYYRLRTRGARAKVYLNDSLLLQRLVYINSEPYERLQEESGTVGQLDEEDLLVRYVGYLARITVKRNSFYVALGVCRFIYEYQSAETRSLYEFLMQDTERYKGEDYYRKCKAQLRKELAARFAAFLRITKGMRGEEHFEIEEHPERHTRFLLDCLKACTPWRTKCALPEHFNPICDSVSSLSFNGSNPDNEYPIEMNRIHSLLHPRCFFRMVRALRFALPEKRLAIPHFVLSKDSSGGGTKGDRHHPPMLESYELADFQGALVRQASIRKKASLGLLSIKVDGIERARIDLSAEPAACIEIEEGAELLEVDNVQRGQEVALGACLLSFAEIQNSGGTTVSSVALEGGQKLKFITELVPRPTGENLSARVQIEFETSCWHRAKTAVSNAKIRIREQCSLLPLRQAAACIFIVAVTLGLFFGLRQIGNIGGVQANSQDTDIGQTRQEILERKMDAITKIADADSRRQERNPYDLTVDRKLDNMQSNADKLMSALH